MHNQDPLAHVAELPDHSRVLDRILCHFRETQGAVGVLLSGSTARGGMDRWSDLDVGVVFGSDEDRIRCWERRWDWDIAPWFHRFDADHIKPHFVIYLYEPEVKADIALYTHAEMPARAGRPYSVAWDACSELTTWAEQIARAPDDETDWSSFVHEDERFWAWMFYVFQRIARGESYHVASEIAALRDIVEQWCARLSGQARFDNRRLAATTDNTPLVARLGACFPSPERAALKAACLCLMDMQTELRARIEAKLQPEWMTSNTARRRIEQLVRGL